LVLDEANGLIENQSFELDEIRKDCNNEVKSLRNSLLERDSQIGQLEEDLLRNAEEKKGYLLEMLEPVVDEVEKLVNANEAIGDHSRKIILQETQKIKFILKEIMQFTPGEDYRYESPSEKTFDFSLEDLGYVSRSSTPIKLPGLPWTERCKRSQFRNVELDNTTISLIIK
jgi:hypothetical protein